MIREIQVTMGLVSRSEALGGADRRDGRKKRDEPISLLSRLNAADVWAAFLSHLIWMFFPRNCCYQALEALIEGF
jgi:hypothetical protein